MESKEIKNIIEQALATLYRVEKELISDKAHEQAISARLMLLLQRLLPDWNVDVEFNRQGENRGPKTDAKGIKRKPDIIIHKRGPEGSNLAVILVKCEWNTEPRKNDADVVQSIKEKHHYQAAFLLEIMHAGFQLTEA